MKMYTVTYAPGPGPRLELRAASPAEAAKLFYKRVPLRIPIVVSWSPFMEKIFPIEALMETYPELEEVSVLPDDATVPNTGSSDEPMDGRTIAAWVFFVIAAGIWGIFFGLGAFISFVERPSGFEGMAGPIYMFMLAPVGALPALIGGLVGKGRSRASNLILLLVILCIEAAVMQSA